MPKASPDARKMLDVAYGWLEEQLTPRAWASGSTFSLADCSAAQRFSTRIGCIQSAIDFREFLAYRGRVLARALSPASLMRRVHSASSSLRERRIGTDKRRPLPSAFVSPVNAKLPLTIFFLASIVPTTNELETGPKQGGTAYGERAGITSLDRRRHSRPSAFNALI